MAKAFIGTIALRPRLRPGLDAARPARSAEPVALKQHIFLGNSDVHAARVLPA
ncbi:MAG: hypothetical protein N838_15690 [Thiohalocapsa sp. PB-PSB1]|nr:MAG: hypothetical protein N838_15690 [Thiohalocapsa sp. PB-PSB1]